MLSMRYLSLSYGRVIIATTEEFLFELDAGSIRLRENCLWYPLLRKMSLRAVVASSTLADLAFWSFGLARFKFYERAQTIDAKLFIAWLVE